MKNIRFKAVLSALMVICICFSCIPFFEIEVNGTGNEMDIKVFDYNVCAYPDPANIDRMFKKFPDRTLYREILLFKIKINYLT